GLCSRCIDCRRSGWNCHPVGRFPHHFKPSVFHRQRQSADPQNFYRRKTVRLTSKTGYLQRLSFMEGAFLLPFAPLFKQYFSLVSTSYTKQENRRHKSFYVFHTIFAYFVQKISHIQTFPEFSMHILHKIKVRFLPILL